MLPQHFDSTDLLFVEPDDVLKDTVDTFIFKPDAPCTANPEADPDAKVASPTLALASTIAHLLRQTIRVLILRILRTSSSSYALFFLFDTF